MTDSFIKFLQMNLVSQSAIAATVAEYLVLHPLEHPLTHPASMIVENELRNFVTISEKLGWNSKVDDNDPRLSDARIPTTHSHPATDPFIKLIVSGDKPTGANVTPVTLGVSFNYEANSTYVIDIYGIVAPTATSTGCGFLLDVSSTVTYVGTFSIHQLANTGTVSGGSSIGNKGATAMGVSSGMPSTGSNFVTGSMMLITGANTGTATFFFRSETTAVTTCKSGSAFRILKMN